MGSGCSSRKHRVDGTPGVTTLSSLRSPGNGVADRKSNWVEHLVKHIGADPTCVLREFARKTNFIHVQDPSDPSPLPEEDSGYRVRKTVSRLAKLCNETNTYEKRFNDAWDQQMNTVMDDCTIQVECITSISKLFRMSCLRSGMIKANVDSDAPDSHNEDAVMLPSQYHVFSATFHLMQLTSQDVLLYGEGFLSDILDEIGLIKDNTNNWRVEISLVDADVDVLQAVRSPNAGDATAASGHRSPELGKKAIMIRHERTNVFIDEDCKQKHVLKLQLTWDVTMYIDQDALVEIYAPFQGSADEGRACAPAAEETPAQPGDSDGAAEGGEGGADANAHDDAHDDAPADAQPAEVPPSEPTAVRALPKPPRTMLKQLSIMKNQEDAIRREIIHCSAKVTKAVVVEPESGLTGASSKCKKRNQELVSILRERYFVEPVIVKQLETESSFLLK